MTIENTVNARDTETTVLSWGLAKWLVTAEGGSKLSCGEIVVMPGKSHEWHVHEHSDEIIYVQSGYGEFTVGEGNRFPIGPGDAVHIPTGVWHDSHNTGWDPLRLIVMYGPAGPESAEPDTTYLKLPAGQQVRLHTDVIDEEAPQ